MLMKKKLLLFFLMLNCATFVFGQTKVVTGKVTDQKDGSPLPGVSVTVKEAPNVGTQTNAGGTYSISVPAEGKTLVFRYVGYKQGQKPAAAGVINVSLAEDSKQLTEVVVVGYGTQRRGSVTGSITSVTARDIANIPVTSFDQALQGKAAGVSIQSGSGKIGQAVSINIRGISSIFGNTQPLIVIDGVIINQDNLAMGSMGATNPLGDINPNDIETFDILKDVSATAIYGSRGSAGVILITTKKGKAGTAKIDIQGQYGFDQPSRHRQFLNTQQWLQIERRAGVGDANYVFKNQNPDDPNFQTLDQLLAANTDILNGKFNAFSANNGNISKYNTDWEKEVFQNAPHQEYDLSFSGGNDKTTYYIGGQALDQTGMLKGTALQRYSGRVNIESKLSNSFQVSASLNFTHNFQKRVQNDDEFNTPLQIVALSPITPVIDPRTGLISGTPPGPSSNYPLYYNPLISVNNEYFHTNVYRTMGNFFANWDLAKHLTFHSQFGFDQTNQNEDSYANSLTVRATVFQNGTGQNAETIQVHFTVNNTLTYKNTFGDHSLEVLAGTAYEPNHFTLNSVSGQNFPSDAYKTIASAAVISAGTSQQEGNTLISYLGRANYAYKNKYLFSASIRTDGYSNFGANHKFGYFPGVSAGWVLSEEDFLKNNQTISELKLRLGYGYTGEIPPGFSNYTALGLFSGTGSYNGQPGQRYTQIANPDLRWEKTLGLNLGVDFGFYNNRLSGTVEVYNKNVSGLYLPVNVPETTGVAIQTQNLGKLFNRGLEVTINSQNFVGEFKWSTGFNAAYNKNKITFLQGQMINQQSDLNYAMEGQPVGVFYGREYAGVDPANGDALYYLNTKNADGKINRGTTNNPDDAQNVVLGNPTPSWTGGITNNFSYKGFDLSFELYGAFGNKVYNQAGTYMSGNASNGLDNQTIDQLAYWNKPGDITKVPEPRLFDANGTSPSSRYLYGASYVRLKAASLGYTFPKEILSKYKINNLRIFVNAYNLFLITKYKGWDPEVNTDYLATNASGLPNSINLGNDFYTAPQPRTITFGVNVGL